MPPQNMPKPWILCRRTGLPVPKKSPRCTQQETLGGLPFPDVFCSLGTYICSAEHPPSDIEVLTFPHNRQFCPSPSPFPCLQQKKGGDISQRWSQPHILTSPRAPVSSLVRGGGARNKVHVACRENKNHQISCSSFSFSVFLLCSFHCPLEQE